MKKGLSRDFDGVPVRLSGTEYDPVLVTSNIKSSFRHNGTIHEFGVFDSQ